MPIDRTNTNTARPLKPTLASNRTARPPVTPRLASSTSSTTTASQPRSSARSNVGSTPRTRTAPPEEVTPVKAFLSSNITPRSSSRKSRVGVSSAESTPSGTPTSTPSYVRPPSAGGHVSKDRHQPSAGPGPGAASYFHTAARPRSMVNGTSHSASAPRPPISNLYPQATTNAGGARATSPKFFHANDAKSQEPAPPPIKKAPTFFYADGQQDESARVADVPSPPLSAVSRSKQEAKFFHINPLSEPRSNLPAPALPPTSAPPDPQPAPSANASFHGLSLRPPSPSKENIHLSYRKGASQVIRPSLHRGSSALSIISGHSQPTSQADPSKARRRSSVASAAARLGHGKSASLSSIDSTSSLKQSTATDLPTIAPSPLHMEKRAVSNGSMPESVASAPALGTEALSGLPSPGLQSPGIPNDGKSALERMNELAANARRERKVLDLEISNSSLLAINRSLEKEVRKQKAEIRRFRRMSRAGRFSADTVTPNAESFSASGFGDLSDMSEQEEEYDEDDHEYSDESSFDEGTMSPTTLAERDAAHRLRDEKRLRLDLSKHQELLLDSQKMNQSLKRCLNWTEELIKDANKALNYQVRVSDVQLGGRVLEAEETTPARQNKVGRGLLSPWTPPHRPIDLIEDTPVVLSDRTDRDSGVDVDGLPSATFDVQHYISPLGSPLHQTHPDLSAGHGL